MNDFLTDDITQSKAVIEMLTVANEYCLFFENAEKYEIDDIFTYFQRLAPLIYLKGSLLPEAEESDDIFAGHFVTEEEWEALFNMLHEKFGKDDLFHKVDGNLDVVKASLAENLADIYQDLKDFVLFFNQNTFIARKNALVQLNSLFAHRWGLALLDALLAIHHLVAGENEEIHNDDWDV